MISEVEWYRKYGKHPERIVKDSSGQLYVIGDFSWNRPNTNKKEEFEPQYKRHCGRVKLYESVNPL